MTAHEPIVAAPEGQALALPANLGDLCDARDRAIEIWTGSYEAFHAASKLAAATSVGGALSLTAPHDDRYSGSNMTRLFMAESREKFVEALTRHVDRRCWSDIVEKLGFDVLLDRQAREEFSDSLKNEPPVFNVENVRATLGTIWGQRRDIYLRGIANVFMAMDRRFRSHDAFAIGNRLIIERAFSEYSCSSWDSYNRRDTLIDVERIFRELDGLPPLKCTETIAERIASHRRDNQGSGRYEDDYFKVDHFLNRNVHFWFKRKDLLKQVNELLLEYYKPVEGDVGEGPSYESAPLFHSTPARHFGEFFSSPEVCAVVMDRAEIATSRWNPDTRESENFVPSVLEPSAGGGIFAMAAKAAGAAVQCVELQPGLAHELRAKGLPCITRDFLKMKPADVGLFDYILMNPPFDRGRDCDHVRHALTFLKPGGRLVAVMSARAEFGSDARHKALHDLIPRYPNDRGRAWHDLPERSFAHAGTNVNTVTLTLKRPWK